MAQIDRELDHDTLRVCSSCTDDSLFPIFANLRWGICTSQNDYEAKMVTFDVENKVDADDENSIHDYVNDDNNDRDHAANTPHAKSTVTVAIFIL